jgi:hypothetical protein
MLKPFRRFLRRQPPMIGTPPSERPMCHEPEAHAADFADEAAERLINRLDAVIAHEYEEAIRGGSHLEALGHGPATALPIREAARELLRAMRGSLTEQKAAS